MNEILLTRTYNKIMSAAEEYMEDDGNMENDLESWDGI